MIFNDPGVNPFGGPLGSALEEALKDRPLRQADAATVALARRYAADMDTAEVVSLEAQRVLERLEGGIDPVLFERLRGVLARIERTMVLATLGPKYQSALAELGMTPRARADKGEKLESPEKGGESDDNAGNSVENADDLERIRRRRQTTRVNAP